MVLTKSEIIASLQHEVRILLHLASKIDRSQLEYRPTPKQRSTIELLQYLTVMGRARACGQGWDVRFRGMGWRRAGRQVASVRRKSLGHRGTGGHVRGALVRLLRHRPPWHDHHVRQADNPRSVHCQHGSLRLCSVPHTVVPVPEGVRTGRAEHDEPVGGHGCTRGTSIGLDARGGARRSYGRHDGAGSNRALSSRSQNR